MMFGVLSYLEGDKIMRIHTLLAKFTLYCNTLWDLQYLTFFPLMLANVLLTGSGGLVRDLL